MFKSLLHILFILPLAALLLMGCGPSGSSFRINGSFTDMQGGEMYVYNLSSDNARFDTITVQNGEFLYKGQVEEVTPFMLVFPNGVEQVIFVGPGQELDYEATANDLKNYVVNGSEENKLMNKFRQETYTINPTQILTSAREYINANIESPVAIYLFDTYFVQNENVSNAEIRSLLKTLKAKQPDNRYLLDVEGKINLQEHCAVGKKLPNVTLTTIDNKTKKLWTTSKDYNLIAVWATWAPNGYEVAWKLRQINDEYKKDNKLRIVSISLDIEHNRWEESIRNDSTNIIEHFCDGLAFESQAIKSLGISTVPMFILTDKKHKVLNIFKDASQIQQDLKTIIL